MYCFIKTEPVCGRIIMELKDNNCLINKSCINTGEYALYCVIHYLQYLFSLLVYVSSYTAALKYFESLGEGTFNI